MGEMVAPNARNETDEGVNAPIDPIVFEALVEMWADILVADYDRRHGPPGGLTAVLSEAHHGNDPNEQRRARVRH